MDQRAAELGAMATTSDAIKPLQEAARRRVVRWLADVFEVDLAAAPSAAANHEGSSSAAPITGTNAKASAVRKGRAKKSTAAVAGLAIRGKPKSAPGHDKTLNLYPDGKKSFEEFVTEKAPADKAYEHNLVAVYWLTQVADVEAATSDQVYSCYRNVPWKLPHDLRNSLSQTASHKGWLDTKDADDIKVTPQGLNFVERQLPQKR